MLWSVSIVRSRALARSLGIFGCVLAVATVISLMSGLLDRYMHLFMMVLTGQTIWFIIAGTLLWREKA